jgi:hypothetical protein
MQFEQTYNDLCLKQNLSPFKVHYEVNHLPPYQKYEALSKSVAFFGTLHVFQIGATNQRRLEIKNVILKETHIKILGEVLRHSPEITAIKFVIAGVY